MSSIQRFQKVQCKAEGTYDEKMFFNVSPKNDCECSCHFSSHCYFVYLQIVFAIKLKRVFFKDQCNKFSKNGSGVGCFRLIIYPFFLRDISVK